MTEERYGVARLDELERKGSSGNWAQIRAHFGIQAFGINAWSGGPGDELISEHDEVPSGQQELYLVLTGRATFTVGEDEVDAPAGTLVFVGEPETKRKALGAEPDTTVIAIGAKPAEAYLPLGWEWSSDAFPLFGEERYQEARDLLAQANEEHPDAPGVLYNLACAEARLGESDEAVAHLRRALELYDGFVEIARNDPDLEPIRDHPSLSLA
jgi:tetratricopeptide (TPR) repeat protein